MNIIYLSTLAVLGLWIPSCFSIGVGSTWIIPAFNYVEQCQNGLMIADQYNKCWFWTCLVLPFDMGYTVVPRRCALGTFVHENVTATFSNPCIGNFNFVDEFECTRKVINQLPVVMEDKCDELECKNGGNKTKESGVCWCKCPKDYQGHYDCSRKSDAVIIKPEAPVPCENPTNYCEVIGGCFNGGICHSQCAGFWCECVSPFTADPLCSRFSCSTHDHCKNGGSCHRGNEDDDEYQVCHCTPEWTGPDCTTSRNLTDGQ